MGDFPNGATAYVAGIVVGVFIGIALTATVGMLLYRQLGVGEQMTLAEKEVEDLREEIEGAKYKK